MYDCFDASGNPVGSKGPLASFFQSKSLSATSAGTYDEYLAAIRTKPFVLLAGISGTGKSRMVRQLARGCCPAGHELGKDAQGTVDAALKPGNYELVSVRPNWHDSTELMGYVTRLTNDNNPKYVIKPFVKFLAKAMIYKDIPFFLCLDEMNLAPVEQYFAEYLSVVETRKKGASGIVSDVLVNFDYPEINIAKTAQELMKDWINVDAAGGVTEKPDFVGAKAVYDQIVKDKGLRIPENLAVMGTVNMDETTCSFSRKVLDRAMTFELNEVEMNEGLSTDSSIPYGAIPAGAATPTAVEAFEVYAQNKQICDDVVKKLGDINAILDNTPFKFAYRSRNEILIYCLERMKGDVDKLSHALDEAISMKILSRIEGDDQKLAYVGDDPDYQDETKFPTILEVLKDKIAKLLNDATCTVCDKKLDYMIKRLRGGFTNFFV